MGKISANGVIWLFKGTFRAYWQINKFIASSETSVNLLQAHGEGITKIDQLLNGFGHVIEKWNIISDVADLPHVLADLGASAWEDVYTVRIIAPQITEIVPDEGFAGDIVAVEGKGFDPNVPCDPNVPSHNEVYFTRLNDFGTPIDASLEAKIISTEEFPATAERLYVKIPEGFAQGPVEVQVDMLTSNRVIFADDFKATVEIVSPSENADLAGDNYFIDSQINNPPDSFPESAAVARYYVDGEKVQEKQIETDAFTFTLDNESLEFGSHTIRIEVEFPGRVIYDELHFNRVIDLSGYNLAHIRVRFVRTYNIPEGDPPVDGYINFIGSEEYHHGTFQGSEYTAGWDERIWDYETRNGNFSISLNSERDKITGFSFQWGSRLNDTTYTKQFQGRDLPLTSSGSTYLEFSVSGSAVSDYLIGAPIHTEVNANPDSPFTKQITSWECNENSYLEITLYKD